MNRLLKFSWLPIFTLLLIIPGLAVGDTPGEVDTFKEFFTNGQAYISGRYRYEFVDQDDFSKDAKASTLRTRLGFDSAEFMGVSGKLEFEDVSEIGNDLYNSTDNGVTDRPVVADPSVTLVNQAYLDSTHIPDTHVRAGRYRLVLDNLRFIGDVGWRQNNQVFDGAWVKNSSIEDLEAIYGYIWKAQRIFGPDHPDGQVSTSNHIAHVKYSGCDFGTITGYGYFLDLEDLDAASNLSAGGRFNGKYDIDEVWKILYDLEAAYQEDYGDNPVDYSTEYMRADLGVGWNNLTVKGGFESLGSDSGTKGFQTPLATLHKWNGWADKFLATPDAGLQDSYGVLAYNVEDLNEWVDGTKLMLVYHYFQSDQGSTKYGEEWDVNVTKKFMDNFYWGVKYANYEASSFATDTQKLIFTLGAKFTQDPII